LHVATLWIVTLGLLFVSGCSLTPSMSTPEAEATLPSGYDGGDAPADTLLPEAARDTAFYDAEAWWTSFGDPTLNTLIDTALVDNLDLAAARSRLEEIQAQFRIARAPLVPSVSGSGQGSRQSQPANTGIGGAIGGGQGPDRFEFVDYSLSATISYELDLWGRVRSQRKAALSEFFASAADLQNARIAIISQTVSTYFQYATLQEQVRLADENVALLRDRFSVTRDRYDRGLATSFELFSVRQQLEQARANQPSLNAQLYDARTRLAVLVGRFAGEERALLDDTAPDTLALDDVPAGLPSDLLMRRPDVMASASRLEATRQRIGVARAELLPSLSLTGTGGTQSSTLADLLNYDQRFTNLIGSLTAPLFQGGALWSQVDVSKARYEQQVASYEQTLLTAFQEVNASLVGDARERERYARIRDQLDAAEASAENQRRRYERGIGDYLVLLDAEQNLVQARQRFYDARLSLVNARLSLHQALGGSWTDTPDPEDPRLFQ